MNLSNVLVRCNSLATKLLSNIYKPSTTSVNHASGRWWPQPHARMHMSSKAPSTDSDIVVSTSHGDVTLKREDAAPIYYKPKGEGKTGFALVPYKDGEQIANYVLFEASMDKAKVSWENYDRLTKDERTIYMTHLKAIEERKLTYKDPFTGYTVFTVSHHLYRGSCCGNGCRHCPYKLENAKDDVKKKRAWNGAFYV
ncbi:hypothetical protein RB195_020672 [Necator americanus]|uniref:Uncharacterized protein n=1 Tax=Necator americanus TaxID=51031 RepID=A0ABR1CND4_NECAM